MSYRYLHDVTHADVAFESRGATLEEAFIAAGRATLQVMVENVDHIDQRTKRDVEYFSSAQDATQAAEELLFDLLEEIIIAKDAERLFLVPVSARLERQPGGHRLAARLVGEPIDRHKHQLNTDVKAVTMHRFRVEPANPGWKATVVLDV